MRSFIAGCCQCQLVGLVHPVQSSLDLFFGNFDCCSFNVWQTGMRDFFERTVQTVQRGLGVKTLRKSSEPSSLSVSSCNNRPISINLHQTGKLKSIQLIRCYGNTVDDFKVIVNSDLESYWFQQKTKLTSSSLIMDDIKWAYWLIDKLQNQEVVGLNPAG